MFALVPVTPPQIKIKSGGVIMMSISKTVNIDVVSDTEFPPLWLDEKNTLFFFGNRVSAVVRDRDPVKLFISAQRDCLHRQLIVFFRQGNQFGRKDPFF